MVRTTRCMKECADSGNPDSFEETDTILSVASHRQIATVHENCDVLNITLSFLSQGFSATYCEIF